MTATKLTTPRRLALTVLVAVALTMTASCSSSTKSAQTQYCDAWSNLATSFGAYNKIDVVNGGVDSIRKYFDQLKTAASDLQSAADSQLKPSVDAFVTSLDALGQTITSGSLPVDRRAQVKAAATDVDAAWNTLVAKAKANCPSVTGTTIAR